MKKKGGILIIDDDVNLSETLATLLTSEGYDVESANSCREALDKISDEEYFSLMIVDIKLPDFGGIEFLRKIEETNPQVRKIILTGYPSIENTREALQLGVHAYLVKPVDPKELLRVVEEQVNRHDSELRDKYISLSVVEGKRKRSRR